MLPYPKSVLFVIVQAVINVGFRISRPGFHPHGIGSFDGLRCLIGIVAFCEIRGSFRDADVHGAVCGFRFACVFGEFYPNTQLFPGGFACDASGVNDVLTSFLRGSVTCENCDFHNDFPFRHMALKLLLWDNPNNLMNSELHSVSIIADSYIMYNNYI